MDIVLISQYLRNIEDFEGNNSRFVYLAKCLEKKHSVELITSDFLHTSKKHAERVGSLGNIKVTALHEPGYPKNVCLRRFYSHKKLGKEIARYLENRKTPDLCYCAVPSLDVAYAVAKYCQRHKVRFIIDVQDLWPEAFQMVFHIPVISDMIFAPMKGKANKIYGCADHIVAVSQTYAQRAMSANNSCATSLAVYLGTEKESFDLCANVQPAAQQGITVGYIGSMSESYDLISVIDAIAMLQDKHQIRLLAIGDGARRNSFMEYSVKKGICAEFPGRLPYPEMVRQLTRCHIAVNPIRKGSAGSIINKVGDYAMAGLPVVNTQECEEYKALLEQYGAGINCNCEDAKDLVAAISRLASDDQLRAEMAAASRKLGTERFDRKHTYSDIVRIIENEKKYASVEK